MQACSGQMARIYVYAQPGMFDPWIKGQYEKYDAKGIREYNWAFHVDLCKRIF